jgi:isopentenyl-diphosphate delta-isomerase
MTREDVILVDDNDAPVGVAEKLQVHRTGQLHRAVSVFLFDANGSMWLQRRALHKYHTPGLWTNACCTHPRPGERTIDAATRRVREELGLECPDLQPVFKLLYWVSLDKRMIEHEYDHVFSGPLDTRPIPNPGEVAAVRCVPAAQLRREVQAHPEWFTPWFRIAVEPVLHEREMQHSRQFGVSVQRTIIARPTAPFCRGASKRVRTAE